MLAAPRGTSIAMRGTSAATLAAALIAGSLAGCASSSPGAAGPRATTLADAAAAQRTCIGDLRAHLGALAVRRMDAFLTQTLNGLLVCDADAGLAHLPTRDVSAWLGGADGKAHPRQPVPDQPRALSALPHDPAAAARYQRACVAWLRRFLPAGIAKAGDDPDTAAARVFDGIEDCDAAAGFAVISRDDLARIVRAKDLD